MVVCKFYLEGCCKYGNQCRFEHVDPYHYDHRGSNYERPSGTSVLKSSSATSDQQQLFSQHSFQSSQPQQPSRTGGSRFNIHDMMQLVSKDVLLAEKGNQWPLSCYSPIRDLINIPELLDYSSEELRWECYMAIQNGRLPVCQAIVQQLYANASKVNSKLKKKDTAYEIIEKWLREGEANAQSQQLPPDGSNNFTNSNAGQMFSSSITQPAPVSSFSFSIPQQEPMGSVQPQQPMPLYIPQQVGYPQQQQTMGFQPQPAASASSVFGGGQFKPQPPQHDVMDKSAYSLVEELVQSELDAYKADRFVFGHIPTKAPPRELCG